jgi:protein-S-isoprenylcysteine O-methyltransferase Ste14
MTRRLQDWINFVWLLVGVYWAIGALRTKPSVRREPSFMRIVQMGLLFSAYLLLLAGFTRVGVLGIRVVPFDPRIGWVGFCFVVAGAIVAVWARTILGANWSAMVTVKRDHELVRRGPYALVRHPIYTGLLLGFFGTALAQGEVRGAVALVTAFIVFSYKAGIEERFMEQQFGDEYARYKRDVKKLIPFVY